MSATSIKRRRGRGFSVAALGAKRRVTSGAGLTLELLASVLRISLPARSVWALLLGLAVGAKVSAAVYLLLDRADQRASLARIEVAAAERLRVFEHEIAHQFESLDALAQSFQQRPPGLDATEFTQRAQLLLTRLPEVYALFWLARVAGEDRAAFEASFRERGDPDFVLWALDADDMPTDLPGGSVHYPVIFVEPDDLEASVIGLDVASMPGLASTLERAALSGETLATDRLAIPGEQTFGVVVPVADPDGTNGVQLGWIGAAMDVEMIFVDAVSRFEPLPLEFRLVDLRSMPGAETLLEYAAGPPSPSAPLTATAPTFNGPQMAVIGVSVAGQDWQIEAWLVPGYAPDGTWAPEAALAGGLVITLVASAYIATILRRRRQVEAIVAVRTEELRAANEELESVVETMPAFLIGVGAEGVVQHWNQSSEAVLGLPASATLGRPLEEVGVSWDSAAVRSLINACRRSGSVERDDSLIVNGASDKPRLLSVAAAPLGADNRGGFLLVGRDVTADRELELELEQARKLESVGRLAAGVAHDFNNVLQVMQGYAAMLRDGLPTGSPGQTDVAQILAAGDRAAALTQQLLAFSRRQPHQPTAVDLNLLVRDLEGLLRPLVKDNIELVLDCRADGSRVLADQAQIETVILNLAANAVDAMPDSGTLTVSAEPIELGRFSAQRLGVTPGGYVALVVEDTGEGMSSETRARVFEPFFTTKARGRGTGLGLATTYGIVEQNRGAITVESEPGQGTRFRIYLPRTARLADGPVPPSASEELTAPATILLVEDEEVVRTLLVRQLKELGHRVLAAENGETALVLDARADGEVDVLLSDIAMPGMGGIELARQLRDRHPRMVVVLMSGYSDVETPEADSAFTPVTYIQKPFNQGALARALRRALQETGSPDDGGP